MKIAVVSNMYPDVKHPSYGVFVKNFCNILDGLGIEYKKYVMLKSDSIPGKILGYIRFYAGTAFSLLFGSYDMVYVHYASHSSIPVLIAHRFRKKTVFTNIHGSDAVPENEKQEKMQKYTRKILGISTRIVVPSEYFRQLVIKKYNIIPEKVFVSPSGGVDGYVFYKEKEKNPGEVLKIGYVGRISYKKGWDTLLKSYAQVSVPCELTVVGNGPDYLAMRKLAKELGVDYRIQWRDLLSQEKLREVYNGLDVFIFPTEREGESLGLVALEAMACGTPVIAADYAAPKFYVKDGENGYKFESGNEQELKKAIERYALSGISVRRKMEEGALKTAKEYSVEAIMEGMDKILRIQL